MARGIWKGSLSFGLVTIGVELFNAEAPERLDLDLLDKRDMSRIGYLKINKSTGEPVERDDIVRGYAVSPKHYVILTDEDLKAANPKATRTIDVLGFIPADAIPRFYYDRPYLIAPTKGSDKAYALLRDTLDQTGQVAVAQMVIRTRQYLVAVYPFEGALVAQVLRYDEEVRKPADLGIGVEKGTAKSVRPAELAMAKKLVAEMTMDWKPAQYHDEYRDDVVKLAKRRAKGAKPEHVAPEPSEPKVLDLMDALKRSVDRNGSSGRRRTHPARRTRRSA
ncbi:MAG: Ku protein [Gemmatimonadales bacterium]